MMKQRGASTKLLHAIKYLKTIYRLGLPEEDRMAITNAIQMMLQRRFELK